MCNVQHLVLFQQISLTNSVHILTIFRLHVSPHTQYMYTVKSIRKGPFYFNVSCNYFPQFEVVEVSERRRSPRMLAITGTLLAAVCLATLHDGS